MVRPGLRLRIGRRDSQRWNAGRPDRVYLFSGAVKRAAHGC